MKTNLALFACFVILIGSVITKSGINSNSPKSIESGLVQPMPSSDVSIDKKSVEPDSLIDASKKVLHKETKSLIRATFDCIKSVCTE